MKHNETVWRSLAGSVALKTKAGDGIRMRTGADSFFRRDFSSPVASA